MNGSPPSTPAIAPKPPLFWKAAAISLCAKFGSRTSTTTTRATPSSSKTSPKGSTPGGLAKPRRPSRCAPTPLCAGMTATRRFRASAACRWGFAQQWRPRPATRCIASRTFSPSPGRTAENTCFAATLCSPQALGEFSRARSNRLSSRFVFSPRLTIATCFTPRTSTRETTCASPLRSSPATRRSKSVWTLWPSPRCRRPRAWKSAPTHFCAARRIPCARA